MQPLDGVLHTFHAVRVFFHDANDRRLEFLDLRAVRLRRLPPAFLRILEPVHHLGQAFVHALHLFLQRLDLLVFGRVDERRRLGLETRILVVPSIPPLGASSGILQLTLGAKLRAPPGVDAVELGVP